MSRTAVELLLYLTDEAFEGRGIEATGESQSLLGNLRSVTEDDWPWTPPDGHRSIRDIVGHVGACKYMYDNHAFGNATLTWDDPLVSLDDGRALSMADVLDWLREAHRRLREHVATMDDDELLRLRPTNWGEPREARWIVAAMIGHDLYHAGEINHIRALCQDNDRWAWEPP
jgi:uncharacterized damage-inducible protein DinB